MRRRREDLLFSPMFPLASYCGYNISTNETEASLTDSAESAADEEAKEFSSFHDAVALVAVIIFSSLVLPEMGMVRALSRAVLNA